MTNFVTTLKKHTVLVLRMAIITLVIAAIAGTFYFLGSSSAFLTATPYLFFFWAAIIAKRPVLLACIIPILIGVDVFGLNSYHDAFWIHTHGEVDALALLFVPAIQSAIGLIVFLIAIANRVRSKNLASAKATPIA